jgi:SAM-dependent methyltransferase
MAGCMDASSAPQAELNTQTWSRRNFVRAYSGNALRPVEHLLLERYRNDLAGHVLELGCGAGRFTGHLIEAAGSVHAIDVSERMIDYCRRHYTGATFTVADLRDLTVFEDSSFVAIVATNGIFDILDDAERQAALDRMSALLAPHGVLILSSHNRAYARSVPSPFRVSTYSVRGLVKSVLFTPRRVLNHRRLARFQREEEGYAIVNDEAHGFALLHYYITRDMQARQLAEHGFELLECLDLDGERVDAGALAAACHELHYVARRSEHADGEHADGEGERWRPRFADVAPVVEPAADGSDVRVG